MCNFQEKKIETVDLYGTVLAFPGKMLINTNIKYKKLKGEIF